MLARRRLENNLHVVIPKTTGVIKKNESVESGQAHLFSPQSNKTGKDSKKPDNLSCQETLLLNHYDETHHANLIYNLNNAGLIKLNSEQATRVKDLLQINNDDNLQVFMDENGGKFESSCNPKTRIIGKPGQQNLATKSLLISFYAAIEQKNSETSKQVIDVVSIKGVEDHEPGSIEENSSIIQQGVAEILEKLCNNQYKYIITNCHAGVFRSGSAILFIKILQQHLKSTHGISEEDLQKLTIGIYRQCVNNECKPDFRGIANRLLLNSMIQNANLWFKKHGIIDREIPLVSEEIKSAVSLQTGSKFTLKW